MTFLTKQQRTVLTYVVLLLVVGWAVRAWRTAQPSPEKPAAAQVR